MSEFHKVTPEDLKQLAAPFPPEDLEWRVQKTGEGKRGIWAMVLPYISNRAIQQRLDECVGPHNWREEYKEWIQATDKDGHCYKGQLCGISIKIDGEWITKWDGAECTEFEMIKGGLSSAEKRAGVKWGIGRYLYSLDACWANVHDKGKHYCNDKKTGLKFKWDPPELPGGDRPADTHSEPMPEQKDEPNKTQQGWYDRARKGLMAAHAAGDQDKLQKCKAYIIKLDGEGKLAPEHSLELASMHVIYTATTEEEMLGEMANVSRMEELGHIDSKAMERIDQTKEIALSKLRT